MFWVSFNLPSTPFSFLNKRKYRNGKPLREIGVAPVFSFQLLKNRKMRGHTQKELHSMGDSSAKSPFLFMSAIYPTGRYQSQKGVEQKPVFFMATHGTAMAPCPDPQLGTLRFLVILQSQQDPAVHIPSDLCRQGKDFCQGSSLHTLRLMHGVRTPFLCCTWAGTPMQPHHHHQTRASSSQSLTAHTLTHTHKLLQRLLLH